MVRLSIGFPVRDNVSFVGQAVSSLLEQDFSDFELLVSDNGSTDGTYEMLREFAAQDRRITLVRQTANRGASWNFNETFRMRTPGVQYFKWAAGDDLHRPGYLAATVGRLDHDDSAVLAHTRSVDVDETGAELRERGWSTKGERSNVVTRFASFLRRHEAYQGFGVVRTPVMERTQLLAPYADSDLTLLAQIALFGRMVNVDQPLFARRVHRGQSTRTYTTRRGRNAWFDPLRGDQTWAFPAWRMGRDLTVAVQQAPLTAAQRALCLSLLSYWAWDSKMRLANDVASSAVAVGRGTAQHKER